jgi:hypothetical protein
MDTANSINLTDAEISDLWYKGNNAGNGYAVGEANMTPREAAEAEEFDEIRTFDTDTSTNHCVVARDGDKLVAICDANGPWAVDVVEW